MATIIPAIIPTSRADLEAKLLVLEGVCSDVQIDIVDGRYASPASWPYTDQEEFKRMLNEGTMLPECGDFRFEIDLMSEDAERTAGSWISLCATRITLHAESLRSLGRFLTDTKVRFGYDRDFAPDLLSFGLALGSRTDLALIEPYLDKIDYVQFMGIKTIGRQGEPFDTSVLPRIKAFRRKYPHIPIQVDGGVNLASAPSLLQAGVSRLVAGSAIWKTPDPVEAYRALAALTIEHGIYEQ